METVDQKLDSLHKRQDRFFEWAGELQKQFRNLDQRLKFLECQCGHGVFAALEPAPTRVELHTVASRLAAISRSREEIGRSREEIGRSLEEIGLSREEERFVLVPDGIQSVRDEPSQPLPDSCKPGQHLLAHALSRAGKDTVGDLIRF